MAENPDDLVRVRDPELGVEITVKRAFADHHKHLEVLDKPAVDGNGRPLDVKRVTTAKPKPTAKPENA